MGLVKRTTVILGKDDRDYLNWLIAQGKEKGVKSFVSKMFDVYRSMAIYDWRFPGEYYSSASRVAFVHSELLTSIIEVTPEEKRRDSGRRAGELIRLSLEASGKDVTKLPELIKHLRILGHGDIINQENTIIIRNPFISDSQVLAGFLESVLGFDLEIMLTTPSMVFKIMNRQK